MNLQSVLKQIEDITKEARKALKKRLDKSKRKSKIWLSKKKNQRKALTTLAIALIAGLFLILFIVDGEAKKRDIEYQERLQQKEQILLERQERLEKLKENLNKTDKQLREEKAEKEALRKANEQLERDLQAKRAEEARIAQAVEVQPAPVATPVGSGSCDLVYQYDWPQNVAYQICMYESGGNPLAANPGDNHYSWAGCYGSFGLMQINCSYGQVYDGQRNMEIAYQMYLGADNSFRPWTTCAKVPGCF